MCFCILYCVQLKLSSKVFQRSATVAHLEQVLEIHQSLLNNVIKGTGVVLENNPPLFQQIQSASVVCVHVLPTSGLEAVGGPHFFMVITSHVTIVQGGLEPSKVNIDIMSIHSASGM